MGQEVDYSNARAIIYSGIEFNNIFLYEGLLMKTGSFEFATGRQWDPAGVFLSR